MSEIKDGEYVRTNKGTIARIEDTEFDIKINNIGQILYVTFVECVRYYEVIVKHSPNIIDLIEVGDYVNGSRVIEVDNCKGAMREIYIEGQNPETDCGIYFEQIETVITKEQFAQMGYKVKE